MTINPKVVDMYQFNANNAQGGDGADFTAAYKFGIRGIIHKASQYQEDHLYKIRKPKALAAGMLWGAYHFNTSEAVTVQVARFLGITGIDPSMLYCLDLEQYPEGHYPMSLSAAREFLDQVDQKTGKITALYSGDVIKSYAMHMSSSDRDFFSKHLLWLCQYASTPSMVDYNRNPLPWSKPWLWQYTGDTSGPMPHNVPGIGNGMDINSFDGTDADLKSAWSAAGVAPSVVIHDQTWAQTEINKAFQKAHGLDPDGIVGPATTKVVAGLPEEQ